MNEKEIEKFQLVILKIFFANSFKLNQIIFIYMSFIHLFKNACTLRLCLKIKWEWWFLFIINFCFIFCYFKSFSFQLIYNSSIWLTKVVLIQKCKESQSNFQIFINKLTTFKVNNKSNSIIFNLIEFKPWHSTYLTRNCNVR